MTLKTSICTAAFVVTLSTAAHAETMTFSHFVPPTHRVHHGVELWAKSIEEASNGELKVRIFPAQQLGKAQDHYDMIAAGQVDAAWFVPGYSAGRFPIVDAGELPFMISNAPRGCPGTSRVVRRHRERRNEGNSFLRLRDPRSRPHPYRAESRDKWRI
ncbi:hypothetical protein [uncultured Roseibium sp.]|uniref:hypothetical protein n=1 Tax=uncultured Roseibium sp. TaxID=1936171 RepID=UPI003217373C